MLKDRLGDQNSEASLSFSVSLPPATSRFCYLELASTSGGLLCYVTCAASSLVFCSTIDWTSMCFLSFEPWWASAPESVVSVTFVHPLHSCYCFPPLPEGVLKAVPLLSASPIPSWLIDTHENMVLESFCAFPLLAWWYRVLVPG